MATGEATSQWHRHNVIQSWQSAPGADEEANISTGIIGSLFDCIMGVLRCLLEELHKGRLAGLPHSASQYDSLESISGSLFFWGLDFGVSRGDLDETLQHSDLLRETVLIVLISIGRYTSRNLISALTTAKIRRDILSTSSIDTIIDHAKIVLDQPEDIEGGDLDSIGDIFQTLRTKIESLEILSSSLECPAEDRRDSEEARDWTESQDRGADQYYVDLVSLRFPMADKALVQRLGRSNWSRYRHVQKQREYVQKEPEALIADAPRSEFHDSGIGSSAPAQSVFAPKTGAMSHRAQSEYASSVVSSRAEASHKRLPSLPEKARSGEPFVCEVCDRLVRIRRKKEWKRHVFADICAYTCIFNQCSSSSVLFEDREAMTSHMESQHDIKQDTASQLCPLCLDHVLGGRDVISLHFARHLEEIALVVLPTSAGSDNESDESDSDTEEAATAEITPAIPPKIMDHEPIDLELSEKGPENDNSNNVGLDFITPTLTRTHTCEICRFTTDRVSDLHKHMKRHTRPYGCTFSQCNKKFGAKSDWKRHENSQHFQLEAFRCGLCTEHSETYHSCGAYFSRREEFQKHLKIEHQITDPEKVSSEMIRWRIGKNHQVQFWCGFCESLVSLKAKRVAAWDERFNHIAHHFEKEGKNIESWLCVETNHPKDLFNYSDKSRERHLPIPGRTSPYQTQHIPSSEFYQPSWNAISPAPRGMYPVNPGQADPVTADGSFLFPSIASKSFKSEYNFPTSSLPPVTPFLSSSVATLGEPPHKPQDWLRRQYRSYHAPGTQSGSYPSYQGSKEDTTGAWTLKTDSDSGYLTNPPTQSDSEAKDWKCDGCGDSFISTSDLKKHALKHNKPFKCDVPTCKRAENGFTTANDLNRHKKSVHRIDLHYQTYQCASEFCRNKEKIWPRLNNFKQHISRMHSNENEMDLINRSTVRPKGLTQPRNPEDSFSDELQSGTSNNNEL